MVVCLNFIVLKAFTLMPCEQTPVVLIRLSGDELHAVPAASPFQSALRSLAAAVAAAAWECARLYYCQEKLIASCLE